MNCQVIRRKLRKHGKIGLTGKPVTWTHEEWVEEECGTPLFGDSATLKVCSSCLNGWEVGENFILDTEENKKIIESAKK